MNLDSGITAVPTPDKRLSGCGRQTKSLRTQLDPLQVTIYASEKGIGIARKSVLTRAVQHLGGKG
jgi:hypothetical protein